MQLDVGIHLDIEDMIYYAFYKKIVNLRYLRLSAKVSQPVSKYNASKLANFVSPVTILAASNCIFFLFFSESYSKHPSHKSHACSKSSLIKVI